MSLDSCWSPVYRLPDSYVNLFFFFFSSFCYSWDEWKNAWGIEKLVQIQECLFKNSNRHQALFRDVALVHQWERLGVMFIVTHVQSHVAWTPNHSAPFPSCFSHQTRKKVRNSNYSQLLLSKIGWGQTWTMHIKLSIIQTEKNVPLL